MSHKEKPKEPVKKANIPEDELENVDIDLSDMLSETGEILEFTSRKPKVTELGEEEEFFVPKDIKLPDMEKPEKSKYKIPMKANIDTEINPAIFDTDITTTGMDEILDLKSLLNDDELQYYKDRKQTFIDDFEFNSSSDASFMHDFIIEEIISARLRKSQLENPQLDLSRQLTECANRKEKAAAALATSRSSRAKLADSGKFSLSEFIKEYGGRKTELKEREIHDMAEEKELVGKQKVKISNIMKSLNVDDLKLLEEEVDLFEEV